MLTSTVIRRTSVSATTTSRIISAVSVSVPATADLVRDSVSTSITTLSLTSPRRLFSSQPPSDQQRGKAQFSGRGRGGGRHGRSGPPHFQGRDGGGGGGGGGGDFQGRGRGGGRGGGRGRGDFPTGNSEGRGGGRGAGAFEKFRQRRAAELQKGNSAPERDANAKSPKKPNLSRTILEPAARGELQKGHSSGIPRLLAKKGKGHAIHDATPGQEADELLSQMIQQDRDAAEAGEITSPPLQRRGGRTSGHSTLTDATRSTLANVVKLMNDPYDSEEEYDEMKPEMATAEFENHPDVSKDESGVYTIEYDSDWGADPNEKNEEQPQQRGRGRPRYVPSPYAVDPEESFFFRDMCDFTVPFPPDIPDVIANKPVPLKAHGPNLDDFLQAMVEHPTKYATVTGGSKDPESLREAKPFFPKGRVNPSFDFVQTNHRRFIYVAGLPHSIIDGDAGDLDNPLHHHEVQKTVARLFKEHGVKSENVSPASMTSAFIGFDSPQKRDLALAKGPNQKVISSASPIAITDFEPTSEDNENDTELFVKDSPPEATIVKLEHLPPNQTAAYWGHNLFPANTKVGTSYGQLSAEDILITSPTTALVRLKSAKKGDSAVSSDAVIQDRLTELSQSRIRCFRAKHEILYEQMTGPAKASEAYKRGPRLVVDGDTPSKDFFLCHYDVIEIWDLDHSVTKQEVSDFIQPFCCDVRDVRGSVEFITCSEGLPTGRAFVGFDQLGEAEKVFTATNGRAKMDHKYIKMRKVKEMGKRKNLKRETRSLRSEEELLDDLNNWEKHVDPKDLQTILDAGIDKQTIDNALRTLRFKNKTYGPFDQAMSKERFRDDREIGDEYREAVQYYIESLKGCLPSREEPGLLYDALFSEDEEVDVSMIPEKKERKA